MALIHDFYVVDEKFNMDNINSYRDKIEISDSIIQYINDSLKWVTMSWNNKKNKEGINYYGSTVIKKQDVKSFKNIIKCWNNLFLNAPNKFYIKGNFLYEEDKYEKIFLDKTVVIKQFELLQEACEFALIHDKVILHIGI